MNDAHQQHRNDAEVQSALETLAEQFTERFAPRLAGPRTVGREAEYPLVTAKGEAADLGLLWPRLQATPGPWQVKYDRPGSDLIVALIGPDFSYEREVGRGTVEINTRPCADLFELKRIHDEAVQRLVAAAGSRGWRVLGYGVHPLTPPSPALLSPKQRYLAMLEIMGDAWLWYTVTAADQTQIDIAQPELIRILNVGNLMAPVIVALCANSPVSSGRMGPFCSAREGYMGSGPYGVRHGMPARSYASIVEFVQRIAGLPRLLRRQDHLLLPDGRPYVEALATEGPDLEAFLLHEHYVWHSARLRVAYSTVEMRPACQQPQSEAMAANALCLGLIEAAEALWTYAQDVLGQNYWQEMRAYWSRVLRAGLDAPEPAPGFLAQILRLAEEGLARRGRSEEALLAPLWSRLEARRNPAQRIREVFAQKGMTGLLAETTLA